jgi:hypothetical protein
MLKMPLIRSIKNGVPLTLSEKQNKKSRKRKNSLRLMLKNKLKRKISTSGTTETTIQETHCFPIDNLISKEQKANTT